VIFLGAGIYLLQESFTDPLRAQAVGLIAGAFIIALATILIYFIFTPRKRFQGDASPQSCANAGRLTGDDFVTAGAAKRGGKKSGKHHRKRLNQTAQIDHARGIAAK